MNNGTDPDQAALNAAYATLQTAYHDYSNASASAALALTIGLGADYQQYVPQEEDAYITEQDGIASAQWAYDLAQATAWKTQADADADAEASDAGDEAKINATYNDDLDTHQEGVDLQLAGFEKIRQQGYADAQAGYNDAVELAWQAQVIAYATAAKTRDDNDAGAIQSMDDALADIEQQREENVANDTEQFVKDEVAAQGGYTQDMLAATIAQLDAYKNIESQTDDEEVADAVGWEGLFASALGSAIETDTNNDPAAMAEWSVWSQYLATAVGAWQQMVDGEINDMVGKTNNDEAAYEQQVNADLAADGVLASQLESLATSGDIAIAGALDTQNHLDDAAIPTLIKAETDAHVMEVNLESAADVQDEQADTAAEKQQAYAYFAAGLGCVQAVLPVVLSGAIAVQDKAAAVFGMIAQDAAGQEHNDSAAVVTLAGSLIPAAQAAVHSDAEAHKTYEVASAANQVAQATADAQNEVNMLAAAPDSNFNGPQDSTPTTNFYAALPDVPDRMAMAATQIHLPQSQTSWFGDLLNSMRPSYVYNFYFGSLGREQAMRQQRLDDIAGDANLSPLQKAILTKYEVGEPVPDIMLVEGKIYAVANTLPFLVRELISKFNSAGPWDQSQVAGFYYFLNLMQSSGATTQAAMMAVLTAMPESSTRTLVTNILLRMKVL